MWRAVHCDHIHIILKWYRKNRWRRWIPRCTSWTDFNLHKATPKIHGIKTPSTTAPPKQPPVSSLLWTYWDAWTQWQCSESFQLFKMIPKKRCFFSSHKRIKFCDRNSHNNDAGRNLTASTETGSSAIVSEMYGIWGASDERCNFCLCSWSFYWLWKYTFQSVIW